MKIKETQQEILNKMEKGKEYSAFDLQCTLTSLISMSKKGLIEDCTSDNLGEIFSPRIAFKYRKN